MTHRSRRGFALLRATAAVLLVIHGIARLRLGIVDDFGVFLDGVGIPLGALAAWTVTLVEVVGGTVLALGFAIRPLACFFAIQLTLGILLVHASEGWFVVGAGRNGVEYSVLLVIVFALVAWEATPRSADERETNA